MRRWIAVLLVCVIGSSTAAPDIYGAEITEPALVSAAADSVTEEQHGAVSETMLSENIPEINEPEIIPYTIGTDEGAVDNTVDTEVQEFEPEVEAQAPAQNETEDGQELSEDASAESDVGKEIHQQEETVSDPQSSTEEPGSEPDEEAIQEEISGSCGEQAVWVYDPDSSVLTISGEGAVYDYSSVLSGEERPWDIYPVTAVVVEEGITSIGAYAFYGMQLTEATIAGTVDSIGENAVTGTVVIRGYENSFAEEYASVNDMPFSSLGKLQVDLSACIVELEDEEYSYAGTDIKPAVTISYAGQVLTAGSDYTFRYINNRMPGEASVILTGKGEIYTGTVTKTFRILQLENKLVLETSEFSLNASPSSASTVQLKA